MTEHFEQNTVHNAFSEARVRLFRRGTGEAGRGTRKRLELRSKSFAQWSFTSKHNTNLAIHRSSTLGLEDKTSLVFGEVRNP